jgi:uncharacterized protein (TIGR00251 family)
LLQVWAKPGSTRSSIKWDPWRKRWAVSVLSPAQKGQANEEILEVLARALNVPRTSLSVMHGATSSSKLIEVLGLDLETAEARLRGREGQL